MQKTITEPPSDERTRAVVFLRMDDLAVKLCYQGPNRATTAWNWMRRKHLPAYRRGRNLLVREDDVIEALATGLCRKGQARYLRECRSR